MRVSICTGRASDFIFSAGCSPAEILRMRAFCIFSDWHDVPYPKPSKWWSKKTKKIQNTFFSFLNSILVFIYRYVIPIALRCVNRRLVASQMANLSLFFKLVLGISRERARPIRLNDIRMRRMTVECILKCCALSGTRTNRMVHVSGSKCKLGIDYVSLWHCWTKEKNPNKISSKRFAHNAQAKNSNEMDQN